MRSGDTASFFFRPIRFSLNFGTEGKRVFCVIIQYINSQRKAGTNDCLIKTLQKN
ncbi:hypothetical protein BSG1_17315 [Bacillus sp. SG-1]|nr:hypothetical protein BSG1_17315 [Bacillus sp. SG-1]